MKIRTTFILSLACAFVLAFAALADTWTDPDTGIKWLYTVSGGKAMIGVEDTDIATRAIDGDTSGDILIPSRLGGYPVTGIAKYALYGCEKLTSVTIPEGVVRIGEGVFYFCSGLSSVTFPSSVTCIGDKAFLCCTNLTSVKMSEGLASIGEYAFQSCRELTCVTIPDSVTNIGICAFWVCEKLESVTIPSNITSISHSAFRGCHSLASVTIHESVTNISAYAFAACSGLTSVTIPSSVTSIGERAFSGCSGLTSVTVPSSITSICEGMFNWCTGLKSVTIPSSVTSIGSYAFENCMNLTGVTIPSSVTSIGVRAFYSCDGLKSVTIPSSVTSIGIRAFSGCSGLTSVTVPSSVTSIGEDMFSWCTELESVAIPSSVTSVGDEAFYICRKLKTVYVEAGDEERVWGLLNNSNSSLNMDALTFVGVEPFPDLGANPSQERIAAALVWAADARLAECVTSAADYAAFREWAGKVKASGGSVAAGLKAVQNAPHAWLSYAVGSATLIEKAPTSEDISVEEFSPATEDGKFEFSVSVDGVTVGSQALKENLKQVFGLEGASSLDTGGFSADNVDIEFGMPENGKVRFVAGPKSGKANGGSFFMKVKVNP